MGFYLAPKPGQFAVNVEADLAGVTAQSFNAPQNNSAFREALNRDLSSTIGASGINTTFARAGSTPFANLSSPKAVRSWFLEDLALRSYLLHSVKVVADASLLLQVTAPSSSIASSVKTAFDNGSVLNSALQSVFGTNAVATGLTVKDISVPTTTSSSLSGGAIAGIVIGSVAGVALIVGAGIFAWWWRKRQNRKVTSPKSPSENGVHTKTNGNASQSPPEDYQFLEEGFAPGYPLSPSSPASYLAEVTATGRSEEVDVAKTNLEQGALLRTLAKERILNGMIRVAGPRQGNWKVLVADSRGIRIVSSCCRMADIIAEGVTLVESLDAKRQKLPRMTALYFISPTYNSVCRMIADFDSAFALKSDPPTPSSRGGKNNGDELVPLYAAANVFTTSRVPDDLMHLLRDSNSFVQSLMNFTELNIDFLALEERVFSLGHEFAVSKLFSGNRKLVDENIDSIASCLLSVCSVLHCRPRIRYNAMQPIAQSIATSLGTKLDEFEKIIPGGVQGSSSLSDKYSTTLLILDRSIDVVAPLLHEYTYQAMCNDLLPVDDTDPYGMKYAYSCRDSQGTVIYKEVVLDEWGDPVWNRLRHEHAADAVSILVESFREFVQKDRTAREVLGTKEVKDLQSLRSALEDLPAYEERLAKFTLHANILEECMRAFYEKDLERISLCEQDMAVRNLLSLFILGTEQTKYVDWFGCKRKASQKY